MFADSEPVKSEYLQFSQLDVFVHNERHSKKSDHDAAVAVSKKLPNVSRLCFLALSLPIRTTSGTITKRYEAWEFVVAKLLDH